MGNMVIDHERVTRTFPEGPGMLEAVAVLVPGFSPFRTATPFLIALLAIVLWRDVSRKA